MRLKSGKRYLHLPAHVYREVRLGYEQELGRCAPREKLERRFASSSTDTNLRNNETDKRHSRQSEIILGGGETREAAGERTKTKTRKGGI